MVLVFLMLPRCNFNQGRSQVGHDPAPFSFRTKQGATVSVLNIRDIALQGCPEIIRTRNFTMFTV